MFGFRDRTVREKRVPNIVAIFPDNVDEEPEFLAEVISYEVVKDDTIDIKIRTPAPEFEEKILRIKCEWVETS